MRYRNGFREAEMMEPGEVYEIELQLQATSNLFVQGHCIRIDTSSSNFPHYDVNPNTGEPLGRARHSVLPTSNCSTTPLAHRTSCCQ